MADTTTNLDELQWEGVYCSTVEDDSDAFAIGGIVSVTATSIDDNAAVATGLPKDDTVHPKEDDVYAYDEECEKENYPDNVDVLQLFHKNMCMKCSPTKFMHSSGINRGADVIPVANGNAILQ